MHLHGVQEWHSGESTCHAPMWPGFDSPTQHYTGMWVEFVDGSHPFFKRFFSGFSGFPLSSKTKFDLESEGHTFVSCNPRLLSVTLLKQS